MPVTVETWQLQRSRTQRWWNLAFILLTTALVYPYFNRLQLALLMLLWSLLWWSLTWRAWKVAQLRFSQGQWWLDLPQGAPKLLAWKAGSVRRKQLLIWRYGIWPWQRLIIRPDSLAAGDFQRLLKALY